MKTKNTDQRDKLPYPDTQLLINGEWSNAADGRSLPVTNPANGEVIGHVAHASIADMERAIDAAQQGFEIWREMTAAARSNIMRKAAALLRERAPGIAQTLTLEQGKPLHEATGETTAAADIIEWFADEGLRIYGRLVPSRKSLSIRQMVIKDPVGPVAAFTPWNFPINQLVRKLGAALTAGCSIVVKAAEETPGAPAALIRAFHDAGLPPGVVNLIYGDPAEISDYLIPHPVIKKISFTGSTGIGKQLAAMAGQHMKRVTMELGGHAPVVICDDADVELAVKTLGALKFYNAGQVCISPTRFLVHESIRETFASALAQHARQITVGDGLSEGTQMGPLANARRLDAMDSIISDALDKGAQLLCGGARIGESGNFWQPTVLDNVPLNAKLLNDEPFGPVAAIRTFTHIEEAITESNRLSFGLAGYAFTRSLKNADLLTRHMEVGMLWINMPPATSAELPFGGIKDSGYGTEGGPEAIEAYLNTRAVAIMNE
ncbi:MAG: NAD-dependent succinate-semialdehyde dehydrogenase [Alteromonas oceani]